MFDPESHTILSAKREGRLLEAQAVLVGDDLTIRLPTGETTSGLGADVDRALSEWLGRPTELVEASPSERATYENLSDFEDDSSPLQRWEGTPGSFVDSSALHVLTTASLRAVATERADLQWNPTRFRPNFLVDADGDQTIEQSWVGAQLSVGAVRLRVRKGCSRCVMTTRFQPGGTERQLDILRHLDRHHSRVLGVLASVARAGQVAEGDEVITC